MPVYQSALTNLEHTLGTGRPAIEAVAPGGFFGYLRTHPDEARVFDAAMSSMSMTHNSSVVRAYDFSRSAGVIADIGGGQGALLQAILNQAPDAKGVLFDLPEVLAAALTMERTQLVAGDFLRDPLPTADTHVLKLILHDWPDASALEILSAVRRAARGGGKLLVIETLRKEGPEFNASLVMNISMLALVGGRERSPAELQRMFEKTGFKLLRVIPTASLLQIVEVEAI